MSHSLPFFTVEEFNRVVTGLIERNGQVTALEVKNELRNVEEGRYATQDIVSWIFDQFHSEMGLAWTWNGLYRTYFPIVESGDAPETTSNESLEVSGSNSPEPYRYAEKWYVWDNADEPLYSVSVYQNCGRNEARNKFSETYSVPYTRVYAAKQPPWVIRS